MNQDEAKRIFLEHDFIVVGENTRNPAYFKDLAEGAHIYGSYEKDLFMFSYKPSYRDFRTFKDSLERRCGKDLNQILKGAINYEMYEQQMPRDFEIRIGSCIDIMSIAVEGAPDFDTSYSRLKDRLSLLGVKIN